MASRILRAVLFWSDRLARLVFAIACLGLVKLVVEGPTRQAHAERVIVYLARR
jgi:hypothetical protein